MKIGIFISNFRFRGNVTLTDLPELLPYMQDSINRNIDHIEKTVGKIRAEILYWTDKKKIRSMSRYDVILLSDVIYDEDYVRDDLFLLDYFQLLMGLKLTYFQLERNCIFKRQ